MVSRGGRHAHPPRFQVLLVLTLVLPAMAGADGPAAVGQADTAAIRAVISHQLGAFHQDDRAGSLFRCLADHPADVPRSRHLHADGQDRLSARLSLEPCGVPRSRHGRRQADPAESTWSAPTAWRCWPSTRCSVSLTGLGASTAAPSPGPPIRAYSAPRVPCSRGVAAAAGAALQTVGHLARWGERPDANHAAEELSRHLGGAAPHGQGAGLAARSKRAPSKASWRSPAAGWCRRQWWPASWRYG